MGEFIIDIDVDDIQLNEINSNSFRPDKHVEQATRLLENYENKLAKKVDAKFDKDVWVFYDYIDMMALPFEFHKISESLIFNHASAREHIVLSVKCWIAKRLSETSLKTAYTSFRYITSAIYVTNGFNASMSNKLSDTILENIYYTKGARDSSFKPIYSSPGKISKYISDVVDYLEFYDKNLYSELIKSLETLKKKTSYRNKVRNLPSFKDVLKFKKYIEIWFEYAKKANIETDIRKFYPLVLWWNLTSIIPMRPSEFCLIKRDCLSTKDYCITFPRLKSKHKGISRVEITYDNLPIPEKLYRLFEDYITLTARECSSEYLIDSYDYHTHLLGKGIEKHNAKQRFARQHLHRTLVRFYQEIIHDMYKVNILNIAGSERNYILWADRENISSLIIDQPYDVVDWMLKPGDLRHIAIINMMMQGYDKVEIKRLAGHIDNETQLGYYDHMTNWMDVEISRIQKEYYQYSATGESSGVILDPRVLDFFKEQNKRWFIYGFDEQTLKGFVKLEIGYCKDESMPCPTFNWKHIGCYSCSCDNWVISPEELLEKKEIISQDLNKIYDELNSKVNFLKALFDIQQDELGNIYPDIKRDLSTTVNEINIGIHQVAKLQYMLGVPINE